MTNRIKVIAFVTIATVAARPSISVASPAGTLLLANPQPLQDRYEALRKQHEQENKLRAAEAEKLRQLESRYWQLWKQNLNTDIGDPNARPTRPSPQGMRDLIVAGRELYDKYDKYVQEAETRLAAEERTSDVGLTSLKAQRDMFRWTVSRPLQPPSVRWLSEAEIGLLPSDIQGRYRAIKAEIGAPLPLPAPNEITVAGQHHTKQEVFDYVRNMSTDQIRQMFDQMARDMQKALNISVPTSGADPRVLEQVARGTLAVNAEMVRSSRFWLAALSEYLLERRTPEELDDDVDALLDAADQWLKETENLVKNP